MLTLQSQSSPKLIELPNTFSELLEAARRTYPDLDLGYITFESSGETFVIHDDESYMMIKNLVAQNKMNVNLNLVGEQTPEYSELKKSDFSVMKERLYAEIKEISYYMKKTASRLKQKLDKKIEELPPNQKQYIEDAKIMKNRVVAKTNELYYNIKGKLFSNEIKYEEVRRVQQIPNQ